MTGAPPTILLHVCCACCATACIERLRPRHTIVLFFSNSNIAPREEFDHRLDAARQLATRLGLPLIEDPYDHLAWLDRVKGLEQEPERGLRCDACFAFSLGRTADYASSHSIAAFTTTLTVSPHKNSPAIFRIGGQRPGFMDFDFKKQNGFRRTIELSRDYGLYRQAYCGCEFSSRPLRADGPTGLPPTGQASDK